MHVQSVVHMFTFFNMKWNEIDWVVGNYLNALYIGKIKFDFDREAVILIWVMEAETIWSNFDFHFSDGYMKFIDPIHTWICLENYFFQI